MSLTATPSANRLHIGIFGKTNSGKSSFINAFTGQEVSIVSDVKGTTTDLVQKAMEIHPLGPCVLIDTAGYDDETTLGAARMEKTRLAAEKSDIAVILFTVSTGFDMKCRTKVHGNGKNFLARCQTLCYFRSRERLNILTGAADGVCRGPEGVDFK